MDFVYTLLRVFVRLLGCALVLVLTFVSALGIFLRGFNGSTMFLKSSRLKCMHFLNVGKIRLSDIKSWMSWSGRDMPVLNRKCPNIPLISFSVISRAFVVSFTVSIMTPFFKIIYSIYRRYILMFIHIKNKLKITYILV